MEKKTTKQLEKELAVIRHELNERKEKEVRERHYPRLEKMAGDCFAYRNNCWGSDSPKWDVFRKILEVFYSKEGLLYFVFEECEIDGNGVCTLRVDRHFPYPEHGEPFSGYERIEKEEYESAKARVFLEMASRGKLKSSV